MFNAICVEHGAVLGGHVRLVVAREGQSGRQISQDPESFLAKLPRYWSERRPADEAAQVVCSLPGKGRSAWWAGGRHRTPGEQSPLPLGSSWGS